MVTSWGLSRLKSPIAEQKSFQSLYKTEADKWREQAANIYPQETWEPSETTNCQ